MGGLLITAWGGFKSRINTMALSILLAGAASFLLGVVDSFWIYLSIMGFAGIALPLFNTSATVYLQEKVESAYHGRTFGIYGMISSSLMPISMLFLGPLADKINIEQILIAAGGRSPGGSLSHRPGPVLCKIRDPSGLGRRDPFALTSGFSFAPGPWHSYPGPTPSHPGRVVE